MNIETTDQFISRSTVCKQFLSIQHKNDIENNDNTNTNIPVYDVDSSKIGDAIDAVLECLLKLKVGHKLVKCLYEQLPDGVPYQAVPDVQQDAA